MRISDWSSDVCSSDLSAERVAARGFRSQGSRPHPRLTACATRAAPTREAMAILSDKWIRDAARTQGMIAPFVEAPRRDGCISYGLSSYGYDARVAPDFKIFPNVDDAVVDHHELAPNAEEDGVGEGGR